MLRLVLCAQVRMQSLGNSAESAYQPQLRLLIDHSAVLGAVRVWAEGEHPAPEAALQRDQQAFGRLTIENQHPFGNLLGRLSVEWFQGENF